MAGDESNRKVEVVAIGELGNIPRALAELNVNVSRVAHMGRLNAWFSSRARFALVVPERLCRAGHHLPLAMWRRRLPQVPILVGGPEDLEDRALCFGLDGYLSVDAPPRKLLSTIEQAIERRQARAQPWIDGPQGVAYLRWDIVECAEVCDALAGEGWGVYESVEPRHLLGQIRARPDARIVLCPAEAKFGSRSLVECLVDFDPRLRVVVTSSHPDAEPVLRALADGACDYLLSPTGRHQAVGLVRAQVSAYVRSDKAFPALNVLVVEQLAGLGKLIVEVLSLDNEVRPDVVRGLDAAVSAVKSSVFDAVVLQAPLERGSMGILRDLHTLSRATPTTPIIVLSRECTEDYEAAQRLLVAGAEDVVSEQRIGAEALASRVRNAVVRFRSGLQRSRFVRDLHHREASQKELVARSLDAMMVVDSHDRVAFCNPAAERMFSTGKRGLIGLRSPVRPRPNETLEVPIETNEGVRIAEVTCLEIPWRGSEAWLVAARDVTERHNAAALRERLSHQDRLSAIGQLAAGIAHEINNPASYVVANTQTIQEHLELMARYLSDAPGKLLQLHSDILEMTRENLDGMKRIKSITSDLRSFSRIDSDEVAEVDVNQCVESATRIAASALKHRGRLVVNTQPLPPISGSSAKLAQVMINLVVNAAQALPEGNVDGNQVLLSTCLHEDHLLVSVEDSGPGVPVQIRERIFDPFFTTKAQYEGTGLGLAMSADIVRMHGGRIEVTDSQLGGARFDLWLPRRTGLTGSVAPPRTVTPIRKPGSRLRILVIDDEPLVLRSFSRMLRDHEVVTALGGEEGIRVLAGATDFDVILCDLMMPGVDGSQVFECVAARGPELRRKFVFCSGGAFSTRVTEFLKENAPPLLEKPITIEDFQAAVARLSATDLRVVQ